MSYASLPAEAYVTPPAGTPGWQFAPIPGWGVNPWASNRVQRLAVNGSPCSGGCIGETIPGESPAETTWGMTALVAAGALTFGFVLGYVTGEPSYRKNPNALSRARSAEKARVRKRRARAAERRAYVYGP
jgi:hypothetical protein